MPLVSIGPQKRKVVWTIRRLLTAASEETAPPRPPKTAVVRKPTIKPSPARQQPPRRPPVAQRPAPEWQEDEFNWPHEEFAVIADDEQPTRAPSSRSKHQDWGMPVLDWGEVNAPRSPEPAPRPAMRPRSRPEPTPVPAPARSFQPSPAPGAAAHPAQRRMREVSRRQQQEAMTEAQYREALTEALQREPAREAGRPAEAKQGVVRAPIKDLLTFLPDASFFAKAGRSLLAMMPSRPAKAKPGASGKKARRAPSLSAQAARARAAAAARQQEAEAKAREQDLAKIRHQQEVLRSRLQYALAELRYQAPEPPLQPQPVAGVQALVAAEVQQTPPRPSHAARDGLPPDIAAVAIRAVKRTAIVAGAFSLFANILTLAGPLFLMGAHDFAPDDAPTLLALGLLLAVLFGALAMIDRLRGHIVRRAAGRLDTQLGPAAQEALRHRLATARSIPDGPLRDIASLRQFMSGPGPAAFLDLPWAPISLLIITMMHWSLGLVTGIGMLVIGAIAVASERATRALLQDGRRASEEAARLALESSRDIDATAPADPRVIRWHEARQRADAAMRKAGERMAAAASTSSTVRMVMQSVLLCAGALLMIGHEISSGMMIAVSVICGKALGPIGGAVSQWRGLIGARDAFDRLETLHKRYPAEPKRLLPPALKGRIEVRDLQVTPADAEVPAIRQVSFTLKAGEALGVIGADPAGKSALARALAGLATPNCGWVRLDGADLRMLDRDALGPKIGYLPQTVALCEGTVGENIARFAANAAPDAIVRAAQAAGIHEMIAGLPDGYGFDVGEEGLRLSAAQRQCVGIARAVYGEPELVVLEEPAGLDAFGKAALGRAVKALKASRTTLILITHRPDVLRAVDRILVLDEGRPRAFGKAAKVLAALTATDGARDGEPARMPAATARTRTATPRRTAQAAPAQAVRQA